MNGRMWLHLENLRKAMNRCRHKGRFSTHRWKASRDWYGDASIPNGTVSWTVWTCTRCGEETTEQPDDWCDPRELEADYLRDRAFDDRLTGE
jgi:hypothetical protein